MVIVKLGDVVDFATGIDIMDDSRSNKEEGLPWIKLGDTDKNGNVYYDKIEYIKSYKDEKSANKEDILLCWSTDVGRVLFPKEKSFFSTAFYKLIIKNEYKQKIFPKYLYILLKSKYEKIKLLAVGSTLQKANMKILSHFSIGYLPSLDEQQSIIDIIEPLEKYDLIFSKMISFMNKSLKLFTFELSNYEKNIQSFQEIRTGNLNNDVVEEKGKYPFYNCSKQIKKSNHNSFNGKYILISGNGEIYCWWIDGEFDLYQRVYAIKPFENFYTTLLSFRDNIQKLKNISSGSIIKYIVLSDIKNTKIYNGLFEKELSNIFLFLNLMEKFQEKINNLKNKIINLIID